MELEHRFTVPAGLEKTWAHFNDIEGVAGCFPGATVTEADAESFSGTVKVKLGPIALVYNGTGTFVEKDQAAHRLVIDAKGKDKRGNGTAGALVTLLMTDAGNGSTDVAVTTDLSITGKAAQFGRGNVIKDVSDKLLGQFVTCLEQQLTDGGPTDAPPGAGSAPAPPSGDATDEPAPAGSAPASAEPAAQATPAAGESVEQPTPPEQPQQPVPAMARRQSDDALDLGSTVLPVLVRAYWKPVVVVLVVLLVIIYLLFRD
ncbi:SRPBCC family protein [Nocardioides sp.]|uniref:SRPBCC family protein n=1 Tax=Nocardioides sp. TaxID=35761 RepID=UPI002ED3A31C